MRAWLLVLLVPLAGCLSDDATTGGGWLFYGGPIWTAEEGPMPQAVAVAGTDIIAVGSRTEAESALADRGLRATEVDLDGRLLIPGLFDTHNHILEWARGSTAIGLFAGDGDPFAPAPTTWDPVAGTATQQVTGSVHVCHWGLQHGESSAEMMTAPLTPLELALVSQSVTRDVCYAEAARSDDGAAAERLAVATRASLAAGLTSHVEAGIDPSVLPWLWALEDQSQVDLRFSIYIWPEALDEVLAARWELGHGTEHARLLGMKLYSDGWLGPRTAAVNDLYADRPHSGFAFYEPDQLEVLAAAAYDGGLKVTAHAIGDRAVDRMLDAFAAASEPANNGRCLSPLCGDPRFGLEHASLVSPEATARMVLLGVVPSVQFSFATSDAHWIDSALGPDRVHLAYPWQDMLAAGLRITGSSDWPIEVLQPLWGVERAVTRQEVDGSLPAAFDPDQALSVDQALRAITIDAAYATFQEDVLGSIAAGKRADLVILDEDLFTIDPAGIAEVEVRATFVDGRLVHGAA